MRSVLLSLAAILVVGASVSACDTHYVDEERDDRKYPDKGYVEAADAPDAE